MGVPAARYLSANHRKVALTMTMRARKRWPPGQRGVAKGYAPTINGSVALTFPFARGNRAAARDAIVTAMQAGGCVDTWRMLYRAGWRIVPVTIRIDGEQERKG